MCVKKHIKYVHYYIIRKLQIKTKMRYHYTPIGINKNKKIHQMVTQINVE